MTSKVGPKGQVVIPKEIRDELGIHRGDEVEFIAGDGEARVRPAGDVRDLRGILAHLDVDLTRELEADHRRELEAEERERRARGW